MKQQKTNFSSHVLLLLGFILVPIFLAALCLCKLVRYKISIFIISNRFYGHLAIDTELQLKISKNSLRICALEWPISANLELEKIIRRSVVILPYWVVWPIWRVLLTISSKLRLELGLIAFVDVYREARYYHLLSEPVREIKFDLNREEQTQVLAKLGLEAKKYFCIALRDGSYHNGKLVGQELEAYRNHDFERYIPVIRKLSHLHFVRLGRTAYKNFNLPNLLDYTASKKQSDISDLVLISNSLGLVTGGDGISAVAHVFNIPILYLRYGPWEVFPTFSDCSWIVPSLLRYVSSNRILSIRETLSVDKGSGYNWPFPPKGDLYVHEYSQDEISCFIDEFATSCFSIKNDNVKNVCSQGLESEFWDQYISFLPPRFRENLLMHSNILARVPNSFLCRYKADLGIGSP